MSYNFFAVRKYLDPKQLNKRRLIWLTVTETFGSTMVGIDWHEAGGDTGTGN